ncbi:MAG: hypothetical protein NTZ48_03065 [Candidatus Omnitrophica bacterium]|nr:hypothetical protein [Candidatus Omnitrophota bacterium]
MNKRRVYIIGVLFFVSMGVLCHFTEARRMKPSSEKNDEFQSVTLTTWELAANPQGFSSYLIANMLSPVLWHMREMMPARSPEGEIHSLNRRLKELSSYVRTHVSYPYVKPTRSERDEWGWVSADGIKERLDPRAFEECLQFFMDLMQKNPEDEDYKPLLASGKFEQGEIPYWRNETADIMWAYRGIRNDDRAVGRCYAYAELIAAALHIVCDIPLEKIYLFGNLEHLTVFIDEGTGYMFSLYAYRDRTNYRRSWSQRFEHKEWWAQFYNNPDFVVNGANFFDSKSGVSSIPKTQLEDMYTKLAAFTEGFFEISTPDLGRVEYITSQATLDLRGCNSQEVPRSIFRRHCATLTRVNAL